MGIWAKVGVATGLLGAVVGGGSAYFTHVLLYPGPPQCNEEHYVFCKDPSQFGLKFDDVEFWTSDEFLIRGWFVPGRPGRPGVVLVHGRGPDRHEGMRYVPSLHARGFSLLLIDLRNTGKSQKSFNSMGYHEKKDVHAAVDFLLTSKRLPSAGVFGFSTGGHTSILAMAEDTRIKAGVFEGAFSDMETIVAEAAARDYHLPKYPILPIVIRLFGWRAGFSAGDLRSVDRIGSIAPRAVFIIHPYDDGTVPYHHGEALYQAAREPKKLWSVENPAKLPRSHTRAWQLDKARAEKEIPDFFERWL